MFGFIKKVFFTGLTILSSVNPLNTTPFKCVNPLNTTPFKCISMTNQERKVRPETINVNSDEPVFYSFIIKTSKCSVVVTISMIHMQKCVLMLLKT